MKRYVIERNVPGIGKLNRKQLKEAATISNSALAKLPGKVKWEHLYVVDDKTFCVYLADSKAATAAQRNRCVAAHPFMNNRYATLRKHHAFSVSLGRNTSLHRSLNPRASVEGRS